MRVGRLTWASMGLAMLMLAACDKAAPPAPPPSPAEVSGDATGHYCGMLLADHEGPKGQIHLASRDGPIWFSSVRDTIAFLRLPEEAKDVVGVYVNDMGKAQQWDQPEAGTWVDAREAWFIVDSDMRGGMGANEAVPFATASGAESFRAKHGGTLARLDDIPDAYVLGPVELMPPMPDATEPGEEASTHAHPPADGHEAGDAMEHSPHSDH